MLYPCGDEKEKRATRHKVNDLCSWNVQIRHEWGFYGAHGVGSVRWCRVVVVRGVRGWSRVYLSPFSSTLASCPLLCSAILKHLSGLECGSSHVSESAYLLADDVEFALNPVLVRHS